MLTCVYRPGASPEVGNQFLNAFIERISQYKEPSIIIGDFNFPTIKWPLSGISLLDNSASRFSDTIINSGLDQLVDQPTRFRGSQTPSLLDLLLTTDSNLVQGISYLPPIGISDHATLKITLQISYTVVQDCSYFEKIDYNILTNNLSEVCWETIEDINLEGVWNKFLNILNKAVEISTSIFKVYGNKRQPWFNHECRRMHQLKRTLWQRYRRSGNQEDYNGFRNVSNKLSKSMRKLRSDYENNLVTRGPSAFYKYVRHRLMTKVGIPRLRREDGTLCSSDAEVALILADHFSQSFSKTSISNLPVLSAETHIVSTLRELLIEEEDVEEVLLNLKSSSPGPDKITSHLLKYCAKELSVPLASIMNRSLNEGALPTSWLLAHITPIFKKGDKLCPRNYRPISLTSVVCKVMERLIVKHLQPHIIENKIIPDQQHGFVWRRSVTTNLLKATNIWTTAHDAGMPTDVLYLDFKGAFDQVNGPLLLHKLEHIGLNGKLLKWISAFLSDRKFQVRVGNAFSPVKSVLSGVPQGSVLGPLLFVLYTYDLPKILQAQCLMFADDIKLFGNPLNCHQTLQTDLNAIHEWSNLWLLPLNPSKCTVLHIGPNNPKNHYNVSTTQIKSTTEQLDLGIVVTDNLSWSNQVSRAIKKANTALYLIRKSFVRIQPPLLVQLYKTYVRPHLEYAVCIWYPNYVRDINAMESVQRRATKLEVSLSQLSYEERLRRLKLPRLEDRRYRGDLIQTWKIFHDIYSVDMTELFHTNRDPRLRGHQLMLEREKFHRRPREHFFTNRVFHPWNTLPSSVVSAETINGFKNKFDALSDS